MSDEILIFSGNSNPELAKAVCGYLGFSLGKAKVLTFSDGEIRIEIDEHVRAKDIFIIQSTCSPVNNNLVELILMIDAVKRSSAKRVTAVVPYYGYARQDKKVAPRVPISAKVVANMLTVAGAKRMITMDLHASQIQGFFDIPVDNLFATPVILEHIRERFCDNLVIVSPDAGGVERARAFAKKLNVEFAIVDKRREAPNKAKAMGIVGDVHGKKAVILDDMVDTAGTVTEAATVLLEKGAMEVHGYFTHAVLSGPAISRIIESDLKTVVVTDTIPLENKGRACEKIQVLSIAKLLGEAIIRSHKGEPVTSLFI